MLLKYRNVSQFKQCPRLQNDDVNMMNMIFVAYLLSAKTTSQQAQHIKIEKQVYCGLCGHVICIINNISMETILLAGVCNTEFSRKPGGFQFLRLGERDTHTHGSVEGVRAVCIEVVVPSTHIFTFFLEFLSFTINRGEDEHFRC
jgi:hypothetical protein